MIDIILAADIDPRLVRPGLAPLVILLLLFGALTLLYFSLRRQLRKIDLPHRDEVDDPASQRAKSPDSPGSAQTPKDPDPPTT